MNSGGSKSAFQRSYLIFTNEDTGFEVGQKPSGHVKVEIRGGRGKLHAVAQNLRPGNGRFDYALYILRSGSNSGEPIRAGLMENKLNRWELEWVFDPIKLGMLGFPADDCDVIVILAEYPDRHNGDIKCPLAAYRNKAVEWRSRFRQAGSTTPGLSAGYTNKLKEAEGRTEGDAAIKAENKGDDRDSLVIGSETGYEDRDSSAIDAEAGCDVMDGAAIKTENETADMSGLENKVDENDPGSESTTEAAAADRSIHKIRSHTDSNTIDTTCIYLNGNMCGALIRAEGGTANPCETCQIRHGVQPANMRLPVDMARLKEILDSNFERCDPFHSNRSDYVWWKVTNPVNLNNILYLNSIRSPLLFNPAVMIAHYKYRHFIIGIFTHMDGQKYVVCGVPGMHMVDRKPFGELGTWVQTEGNRLRYGAYGYWLVYINPDDGKMLNPNQNAKS